MCSSAIKVWAITQDNIDEVLNVYSQCQDFLALGPDPTVSLTMVLKDIETSQTEGGTFSGVRGSDGEMIGVVDYISSGYKDDPHSAFISLLMISSSFRNRRIGTRVVELIEKEIRENSRVTTIFSTVQENNPDAIRFWVRNGYQITGGPELRPDQTKVFHLKKDLS